ncbi:MAG: hypothetical protein M0R74_07665 [Dehalococcoidia bacterium]|nr:hypothetical protein [Dehalococcoidia bacterium]
MKRVLLVAGGLIGLVLMTGGILLAYQGDSETDGRRVVLPQLQRDAQDTSPATKPAATVEPSAGRNGTTDLTTGETTTEGGGVRFTFDGAPAQPEAFYWMPGWDVQVHSRSPDTWETLEAIAAQHGPNCEPPQVSHEITEYEASVFRCRDHLMTAINASDYAMIYLTPPYLADFSAGEAVIRFDISTLMNSTRDWWDVWLTPYDENLTLPLEDWLPDAQGEPRDGIHIRLGAEMQVCPRIIKNHEAVESATCQGFVGYDSVLSPDPARRDTVEIRVSRDRLTVGMPKYNLTWDEAELGGLEWTQAVAQFGHHSYNPRKDGAGEPGTWHWDEFEITPAAPFTIIRADRRAVADESVVRFDAPAPANARLRFSGIGAIETSFDDGKSWSPAQRQPEELHKAEHFSAYWTPIPEGVQEVRFRFKKDDWYDGPFLAKDLAIWAKQGT